MRFDISALEKGLEKLAKNSDIKVRIFCETGAQKMEDYAKQHRPWTDRTGNARLRLKGRSESTADGYRISIAHGVDYGADLELKHEKRYAIIPDTLKYGESKVLPAFNRLLERI